MNYQLTDLLDIPRLQAVLDSLNHAYSIATGISDLEGNVLTASGWQDICVNFHRKSAACASQCKESNLYIINHLDEANPTLTYKCPRGLVENATRIIIDGKHLGNAFVDQFFLEAPDPEFFRNQAREFGFDEKLYLEAVAKVPVITREELASKLSFIRKFTQFICEAALKSLREMEIKEQLEQVQAIAHLGSWSYDISNDCGFWSDEVYNIFGVDRETFSGSEPDVYKMIHPDDLAARKALTDALFEGKEVEPFEHRIIRPDGVQRIIVTSSIEAKRDENGKPIRLMGTVLDITELKTAHEKTIEALNETERYFTIIPDLVCVASADGYFKKLNPAWQTVLGYTEEELLGQPYINFVHPDDIEPTYEDAVRQISGGNTINFVNRYRCKDGSYRTLEWRAANATDGLIYAAARDVTEQKKSEEELRRREAELQHAQTLANLGSWSWDIANDKTVWSKELYRIFGVDPQTFQPNAENVEKLMYPSDYQLFKAVIESALEGRAVKSFEHRIMRLDGTKRTVLVSGFEVERDEKGNPLRLFATTLDITERKQAEEALRLSEEKFAKAFLLSPDAVNINRVNDGCYIEINQGFTEIMGYAPEDVIGRSSMPGDLGVWVNVEDRARLMADLMLNGEVNSLEALFSRKDGSQIIGQISAKLITINNEPCILSITRDITQRKRTEEALKRSENLLKATVESAPIVLSSMDLDGIFKLSVGDGLKSLGLKPGQVVGQSVFDVYKDFPGTLDVIRRALKGEVQEAELEVVGLVWDTSFSPIVDDDNQLVGVVCVATDITERKNAEREKLSLERNLEEQKQKFYRETIYSVTQGKLDICSSDCVTSYISKALMCANVTEASEVSAARRQAEATCSEKGLEGDRLHDFVTAVGEAITNAVKHANGGIVYAGESEGAVWVAVQDKGPGIESIALPSAILRRGFSTKPSMGLGYSIMLEVADQILLNTGANGTTVILVRNVRDSKLSLDSLPDVWAGIPDVF